MSLDVTQINQSNLTDDQYVKEDCSAIKKQFVLHHTAGGSSPKNAIYGWQQTKERVATAFVIAGKPSKNDTHKDGQIFQAFGSKYYAYHIYFSQSINQVPAKYHSFALDQDIAKKSIAVEICNWGFLTKDADGTFKTYVNTVVPAEDVIDFGDKPYRGHRYYHAYTDAQIASLKELIIYICDKYKISKKFNTDMFEICTRALDGENGIWTHSSYRSDKTDLSPQPKIIQMLKDIELGARS
jgi:N-acetyl-anhydromuramyl-L-alanine amidase AmpD